MSDQEVLAKISGKFEVTCKLNAARMTRAEVLVY